MKKYCSFLARLFRIFARDLSAVFTLVLATVIVFASSLPALATAPAGPIFNFSTTVIGNSNTLTLGKLVCNMQLHGMVGLEHLFSAIAYIAGCFFMGNGLLELIRHHDNPRERPLHHPLVRICGGMALIEAPYVVRVLIQTFYTTPGTAGIQVCTPGTPTPTSGGVGLDVLITNLVGNIYTPMVAALSSLAILIGLFLIVRGLLRVSKFNSDPRTHSMTHILISLTIGTLLVVVGQNLDMVMGTIFGVSQASMEGHSVVANWAFVTQLGAGQQFTNAISAALNFFQLIGLIAFIRGWLIMKSASEGSGQATMAQGITHIIGGTLALNVFNFLEIMDKTFGTGFL